MEKDVAVIPADRKYPVYQRHLDILSTQELYGVMENDMEVVYLDSKIRGRLFISDPGKSGVFEPINLRATALLWLGNPERMRMRQFVVGTAVLANNESAEGLDDSLRYAVFGSGKMYKIVIWLTDGRSFDLFQPYNTWMDALAESVSVTQVLINIETFSIYAVDEDE